MPDQMVDAVGAGNHRIFKVQASRYDHGFYVFNLDKLSGQ